MPIFKDEQRGTWYVKTYYTDWTGERKQKLKRGFPRQKDAKDWERTFLEQQQGDPTMSFQALHNLYMEDIKRQLKATTVSSREHRSRNHILPYFKDKRVNEINSADIRIWQGIILGKGFKPTYQKTLNEQLSMILNFAKKYYGLKTNPCTVPKMIGRSKSGRMDFWTQSDFNIFIPTVKKPETRLAFYILFYTGLRFGEMMAINPNTDIDLEGGTVTISKTHYREKRQDIVTTPKTENSNRVVTLPAFLVDMIKDYMQHCYDIKSMERLFLFKSNKKLRLAMEQGCQQTGVKRIRLHDLRHSHVSMLIEMGYSSLLIAERIGDTVEMVNNIYGHLYPNKHKDVADALNNLVSK
ncbi:MAG: site-specific integrase [Lachnospiraceae bacterium]